MNVRTAAASLVATGLLLAGAGCDRSPTAPKPANLAPAASSPAGAVRLLEWAINNRRVDAVDGLLTDDFTFARAGTDSAGNPNPSAWPRDTVLAAIQGMLVGSPNRPPAERITLSLDRTLVPLPDPRPGKVSMWHKTILTSVLVTVRVDANNTYEVEGNARFFLTRGDSAAIPAELKARGAEPDSSRWWFDRWEDETLGGAGIVGNQVTARAEAPPGGPTRALPAKPRGGNRITFWAVLRLYLP